MFCGLAILFLLPIVDRVYYILYRNVPKVTESYASWPSEASRLTRVTYIKDGAPGELFTIVRTDLDSLLVQRYALIMTEDGTILDCHDSSLFVTPLLSYSWECNKVVGATLPVHLEEVRNRGELEIFLRRIQSAASSYEESRALLE